MMQAYEIEPDYLDLSTGQIYDAKGNPIQQEAPPPDPYKEEIKNLQEKGVPLQKILKGIDGLPVENPEELKQFAESLYNVFNTGGDKTPDML